MSRSGPAGQPQGTTPLDDSGDNVIDVTAEGYAIEESFCRATNIHPQGRRQLANRFSCSGADDWEFDATWSLVDGKLWFKER